MSSYSRGRHRPDPDSATTYPCGWMPCNSAISYRFWDAGIRLCQDHALQTWAAVQEMNSAGQLRSESATPTARPKPTKGRGKVYYLRIGDRVKIGFTNDIFKRLASYPPTMEILAIREGTRELEHQEHIRFGEHRTDGREWFAANERVLQMVELVAAGTNRDWEQEWFQRRSHQPQQVAYRQLDGERASHGRA